MMARAARAQAALPPLFSFQSLGKAASILPLGMGSPMTPVEARNTSRLRQRASAAPAVTLSSTAACPARPVKTLALPALTTKSRAEGPLLPASARLLLHHS